MCVKYVILSTQVIRETSVYMLISDTLGTGKSVRFLNHIIVHFLVLNKCVKHNPRKGLWFQGDASGKFLRIFRWCRKIPRGMILVRRPVMFFSKLPQRWTNGIYNWRNENADLIFRKDLYDDYCVVTLTRAKR